MIYGENAGIEHLNSVRDGSFKLGLGIGCDLDNQLRWKRKGLTVMAGHANVGKTLSIIYYFTCLAKIHNLKFCVFSSENEIGGIKDDIITLYLGRKIHGLPEHEFQKAHYWLNEHFKFINFEGFFKETKTLMNFRDILGVIEQLEIDTKFKVDSLVIDPYNSLGRVEGLPTSQHLYDYTVMAELRLWCAINNKSCYIMAHGVTEALRKVHPRGHDYEGYSIPLLSADIEGGGKFVNRCDDFVVIHRYTNHKSEWTKTEWHIVKVKNTKTGGKPTFKDNPIILEAQSNLTGFRVYTKEENFAEPSEWVNPMQGAKGGLKEPKPLKVNHNFNLEENELVKDKERKY